MKVSDVMACIEDWAPPALAYSWDRSGLNLGDPKARVTRVLVTLTVTRAALAAAKRAGAQLIVAHHPP